MNRSPRGPNRPKPSLRPPRVGNIVGLTGNALVMGGAAPILFRFVVACRPQAWSVRSSGALVRARLSAATPAGAGGGGRWGARRAGPAASPPPRRGPFWGRGGVPSARRGRRFGAPAARRPGGSGGGGRGGRSAAPHPPAPSGVGLPSFVSGAPSMGYTRAVGVAGLPWP